MNFSRRLKPRQRGSLAADGSEDSAAKTPIAIEDVKVKAAPLRRKVLRLIEPMTWNLPAFTVTWRAPGLPKAHPGLPWRIVINHAGVADGQKMCDDAV